MLITNKSHFDITGMAFLATISASLLEDLLLYISNHRSKHNNIRNNARSLNWSLSSTHDGPISNLKVALDHDI